MRSMLLACLAVVLSGVLAGCGSSEQAEGGGGPSGEMTLYTSEPSDKADELVAAFGEEYPEIDVETFYGGTGDISTRIESEQEAGGIEADVLYVADAPTFESFKEDDLFTRYTPEGAEEIDEDYKDPDGYYTGTRLIGTVLGYNTQQADNPPESFQDLADSEYRGTTGMPSPDFSGAAAYNTALWGSQQSLGWDWIESLVANNPSVVEGNGDVQEGLASGQYSTGIILDYMVRDIEEDGSPVAGNYPEEGTPVVTRPVGIFEDSENREAAETFVDYLISDEGQELGAEQNYIPIRPGIEGPEDAPSLEEVDVMEGDLDELTEEQDAAAERFQGLLDEDG